MGVLVHVNSKFGSAFSNQAKLPHMRWIKAAPGIFVEKINNFPLKGKFRKKGVPQVSNMAPPGAIKEKVDKN